MRLDLTQLRKRRDPVVLTLGEPAAHLCNVRVEEARQRHGLLCGPADEAGSPRDPVGEDVGAESSRLCRSPGAAIERGGKPALRVAEGDEDLFAAAARLAHAAEGLLELVLTEFD